MDSIFTIIRAWGNVMVRNPRIDEEAERRLRICNTCVDRDKSKCGICGCPLIAKSRSTSNCPEKKW